MMQFVVREQYRGKSLTLNFSIIYNNTLPAKRSQIFNIDDLAEVRFKFKNDGYNCYALLSLRKHAAAQDSIVKLDVDSPILKYFKQWTCTEHWIDWQQMGKEVRPDVDVFCRLNAITINMTVHEAKSFNAENIYQDSDWTDFLLSTTDGSVPVHRACLAAHSDVFKTMLSQEWKETADGRIQIEGVTLQTLQHLKQYMYLGTLPDEGLQPLLQLSMCYLIDNLKSACISKLARTVTSKNLDELLVFAVENKLPELCFAVLQLTPDKIVHEASKMKKKEQNCENAEKE